MPRLRTRHALESSSLDLSSLVAAGCAPVAARSPSACHYMQFV
jgi:hypothetical protein